MLTGLLRRGSPLGVVLLAAVLSGSCTRSPDGGPREAVTIAAVPNELSTLVYLADAIGAFADEGLEVTIQEHEVGKVATEAMLAGEADFATAAEYIPAHLAFHGHPLRILAALAEADILRLVARRDRGIERPGDLAGKRVGAHRGTNFEYLFDRFLLYHGVPEAQVTVVDVPASESAAALEAGRVDAVFVFEPIATALEERLGPTGVAFPGQLGEKFYWVLETTEGFLAARPGTAERVLRALERAHRHLADRPDDARSRVVERLGLARTFASLFRFDLSLEQALLLAMENEGRWLVRHGYVPPGEAPNYLSLLHLGPLERVKPEAVTVIR